MVIETVIETGLILFNTRSLHTVLILSALPEAGSYSYLYVDRVGKCAVRIIVLENSNDWMLERWIELGWTVI